MSKLLAELERLTNRRGQPWQSRKKNLLGSLSHKTRIGVRQRLIYHDSLLRLLAFPDDVQVHALAEAELTRLFEASGDRQLSEETLLAFADSGVAGTDVTCAFSLSLATGLLDRFGSQVGIDWDRVELDSAFDELRELLVPHVARDSVRADEMALREWCRWAAGPEGPTLSWILRRVVACQPDSDLADYLFEKLALPVRWRLNESSRTFQRFPKRRLSYYDRSSAGGVVDDVLSTSVPKPRVLKRESRQRLIDLGREVLAVRHRETEALTHPNIEEVSLFNLESGIDVAIYGMHPRKRLPLESFFGFVAAKNRVPVAYGGSFIFMDRCDIGFNVFNAYRGLDSAQIFSSILSTFVRHYRINRVSIDSAQFGYGRRGGIASGAFWFYYKLGFRPEDAELASLAREENARRRHNPGHRSTGSTLRKFTESSLILDSPGNGKPVPNPSAIGAYVLRTIGRRFKGDPKQTQAWSQRYLGRIFPDGWRKTASDEQKIGYQRLSPLIATIPDLAAWKKHDRTRLLELMLAKGGLRERDYVLKMQRHTKLRETLSKMACQKA